MSTILDAFREAVLLIVRFDREFYGVVLLSLAVSGLGTVLGALIGLPLGTVLSETAFRGRRWALAAVHSLMGLPPVVVGLFTFLVLARRGPLGSLNLLYTPAAMIIVQAVLAAPIIAGFTHASLQSVDPRLGLQARSLGATRLQASLAKLREARAGLVAAVIAGMGRVLAEMGAVLIVGGNIRGRTRVLTTYIALQARQGRYEQALAAGLVLIALAFVVNAALTRLQAEKGRSELERRVTGYPA